MADNKRQRVERLITLHAIFKDLLARRREPATDGYKRRETVISTDNVCEAGAQAIADYTLGLADLRLLVELTGPKKRARSSTTQERK